MPYKTGDIVVHPAYGVGQVVRLVEKTFAWASARLYYEIDIQDGKIWVPVENPQGNRLRPITARHDLTRYRKVLRSRPGMLDQDPRKRQVELSERLRQGTFQVLCEIVRDLTARGWQRHLSTADETSLERARQRLFQEWATSAGTSVEDVAREIEALLQESRRVNLSASHPVMTDG